MATNVSFTYFFLGYSQMRQAEVEVARLRKEADDAKKQSFTQTVHLDSRVVLSKDIQGEPLEVWQSRVHVRLCACLRACVFARMHLLVRACAQRFVAMEEGKYHTRDMSFSQVQQAARALELLAMAKKEAEAALGSMQVCALICESCQTFALVVVHVVASHPCSNNQLC